jgi:hypothetical protein
MVIMPHVQQRFGESVDPAQMGWVAEEFRLNTCLHLKYNIPTSGASMGERRGAIQIELNRLEPPKR